MAEKYIRIQGKLVAVSDEVYYSYYHMSRQRRTQAEKDGRRRVASYDAMDTDEGLGIDLLVDRDAPSVEEQVLANLLRKHLHQCISQLTLEEQNLVHALFFEWKTEREYAETLGISQAAVHKRRDKVLKKLRQLIKI